MTLAPSPVRERVTTESIEKKRAVLKAVEREIKIRKAREDLIAFTELLFPDAQDPYNPNVSRYSAQKFHRALARALHEIEAGEHQRVIICMPPRHGKSELAGKIFPAWFIGRDPHRHVMVASYNQPFVNDYGKRVRDIMDTEVYAKVFPGCKLKKGSKAVDRLQTETGGVAAFVGRGGSITGRGSDLFIIDDPLKNSKEADSETIREELWTWFNNDVLSRGMSDKAKVIIIQTRWHEDDLVGRLTDPTNPCFNEEECASWKIINIPAICEDDTNDVEIALGRKMGDALWPERYSANYLLGFKRRDSRGFMALYQQRPTPIDGDLFTNDMINTYARADQVPKKLKIYAASDHAVEERQRNDYTCMVVIGVDDNDVIWVLDVVWKRMDANAQVEEMIKLMKKSWNGSRIITWYAERDHVVKTIGPFLRKRMREEKCYVFVKDLSAHMTDKVGKAQPLIGRMGMRMVMFPKFAAWFERARLELLKFPSARHDDFVDALGLIARALDKLLTAAGPVAQAKVLKPGTWAWFKNLSAQERRFKDTQRALRGM